MGRSRGAIQRRRAMVADERSALGRGSRTAGAPLPGGPMAGVHCQVLRDRRGRFSRRAIGSARRRAGTMGTSRAEPRRAVFGKTRLGTLPETAVFGGAAVALPPSWCHRSRLVTSGAGEIPKRFLVLQYKNKW